MPSRTPRLTVANPWPVISLSLSWVKMSAATDSDAIGRRQRGELDVEDPGRDRRREGRDQRREQDERGRAPGELARRARQVRDGERQRQIAGEQARW